MPKQHFILTAALGAFLIGCSGSTEPKDTDLLSDAIDVGPSVTLSGVSGASTFSALSSALTGNPLLTAAGSTGTLPAPPVCAAAPGALMTCTSNINGLTITYTYGAGTAAGSTFESTISGTTPARSGVPARRILRRATSMITLPTTLGTTPWSTRNVSSETGSSETLESPIVTTADTGSTDVRVFFPAFTMVPSEMTAARLPRMLGSSRRVLWTRAGSGAATYRRETTTYDSSTVIRTRIETASGVKNCSIDLAATTFRTVCN